MTACFLWQVQYFRSLFMNLKNDDTDSDSPPLTVSAVRFVSRTKPTAPTVLIPLILLTSMASLLFDGCSTMSPKLNYPITAKTNVVENYHGTAVADPYRWLEDDNSPATKSWVEAENNVTF